jgi:hypothetical protein
LSATLLDLLAPRSLSRISTEFNKDKNNFAAPREQQNFLPHLACPAAPELAEIPSSS